MALYVDHQQTQQHKHYCRICKKSFACGQALGGHMRAHGINDNISYMEEDDEDDDEDHMSNDWTPNTNNNMYSLRTNPNRLKSCRVCENCGIEFSSWKSFLEHGKCNLEEADSDTGGSEFEEGLPRREHNYNSSKRKRSYRTKVGSIINYNSPTSEEEDLAHCLMMLSNGIVDPSLVVQTEESCALGSKNEGKIHHLNPYNNHGYKIASQYNEKTKFDENPKMLFECKACKKVFNSHQALGGHRASHKKVKGCFAAKLDHTNEANGMVTQEELHHTKLQHYHHQNESSSLKDKKKEKVHECSICYRVFSSGQALGGHKRCHWITSKNSPDSKTLLDLSFNALDAKTHNNNNNKQNSQEMFLLPWRGEDEKIFKVKDNIETRTKFDKLNELKEMSTSETSSQWLQIGLGSTSSQVGSD